MENFKRGTHFFFNSVSASVFPHIEVWTLKPESDGVIILKQEDELLSDEDKLTVYLQIYPQFILIYTHNIEGEINQIIDKALYAFHHSGMETMVRINNSANLESTVMFPTSQSKKEWMERELNLTLNKITQQNQLEENLEKINLLTNGIKLYERFETNCLKSI